MIEANPAAELQPVSEPERVVALDVLRGFAVLGILVINIQYFSMIGAAYLNPTAFGDLTGPNFVVWILSHVLADQKFLTIFSMLFGAGIALMSQRTEVAGRDFVSLHHRRMSWLIVFGLVHAYGFWAGEILFPYGICGLLVYRLRGLRPRTLVAVGVLVFCVSPALYQLAGISMPYWPPEALDVVRDAWHPAPDSVAAQLAAYRGGWWAQMSSRAETALIEQTAGLVFYLGSRVGGLMLLGMAFFKLGVFQARCTAGFYVVWIGLAAFIGVPTILYGVWQNFEQEWNVSRLFLGNGYNYFASLLVAMGWVGVVMLMCKSAHFVAVKARLAAVGRMALTNYLMQTIICTTIFYGHGLGMFGRVSRVGQIGIVVAVCAIQLAISPIWLRHFRYGPAEWLWRSLSYRQRTPFRRQPSRSSSPPIDRKRHASGPMGSARQEQSVHQGSDR